MSSIDSLIANYNPDAVRNANVAAVSGSRLNQAQADEIGLKNKITQRQLHDEEVYRQILADVGKQAAPAMIGAAQQTPPSGAPSQAAGGVSPQATASPAIPSIFTDPRIFQREAARRGMSGAGVIAGTERLIKQQEGLSKLTTDQLDQESKSHALAADSLRGYLETPDGPNKQTAYSAFYSDLAKEAPEAQKWLPQPGQGAPPTSDDLAHVTGMLHLTDSLLDAAKKKADTRSTLASTAKTEAETPGEKAKSQREQQIADLQKQAVDAFKANPNAGASIIDSTLPPATDQAANSSYKAAYQSAMQTGGPEAAQKIVEAAAAHAAQIAMKTNPVVRAGEAAQARETQLATAPGRVKEAKDTLAATAGLQESINAAEANHRNALEQGDTATAKYYESLTGAKKAEATAHTIQRVVELARSGSPLASQQLKAMVPEFTNAAQDIKRMGGTQSASMSSELDKAIGEIKSLGGGSTLSEDTINAIAPFVETIANGAVQQHNANVQALGKAYTQKKFTPEPMPYQTATGPNGHKIVSHDGGETWSDAATGQPVK